MQRRKPKGRDEWAERRDAHLKAHPKCEMPDGYGEHWGPIDANHLFPRGMGGTRKDDSPLISLCRKHHAWAESYREKAREMGMLLRRNPDALQRDA
mgnify:CR=1 FL=1